MKLAKPSKVEKIVVISAGFTFAFILLEVISRFIPVSDPFFILPIKCNKDILNLECLFRRESNKTGRYSKGKFPPFDINVMKSTNDIGQFSDIDLISFIKNKDRIKLLSIGDSFVEAKQVANKNSFHGILNKGSLKVNNKNFISTAIASAGNQLPAYLTNIKYVSSKYNLDDTVVIISIISNDFDESFPEFKTIKSGSFFKKNGGFNYFPYNNSLKYKLNNAIFSNSNLLRYLFINLEFSSLFYRYPFCIILEKSCTSQEVFKANIIEPDTSKFVKRSNLGYKATNIFFNNLEKIRKTKKEKLRTIFIINSDNQAIYSKGKKKSNYFESQRNHFIQQAESKGYSVIDLNSIFKEDYHVNSKVFEFKNDGHWNLHAHKLIAETLIRELSVIIK